MESAAGLAPRASGLILHVAIQRGLPHTLGRVSICGCCGRLVDATKAACPLVRHPITLGRRRQSGGRDAPPILRSPECGTIGGRSPQRAAGERSSGGWSGPVAGVYEYAPASVRFVQRGFPGERASAAGGKRRSVIPLGAVPHGYAIQIRKAACLALRGLNGLQSELWKMRGYRSVVLER